MKEKSQVADIDRSVYDIRDKEDDAYRMQPCRKARFAIGTGGYIYEQQPA